MIFLVDFLVDFLGDKNAIDPIEGIETLRRGLPQSLQF